MRLFLVTCASVLLTGWLAMGQEAESPGNKRAELPAFSPGDTSEVFFTDVFEKLSGERPASPSAVAPPAATGPQPTAAANTGAPDGNSWSAIISPTTIEDEIKAIKKALDESVTTPSDFAGRGHKIARREFSMLSLLFAIISEYDGDVRWKDNAGVALNKFGRVASNTKAGGNSGVYGEAKQRLQDLDDLLRGSRLNGDEVQMEDWGAVADRGPLMQRLETAHQKNLTPWTSSESAFKENAEGLLHEAEIVAALAEALIKEGMEDADDEDYASFAKRMKQAALEMVAATKSNNHEMARTASGEITKACTECHELYR